MSQSVTIEVLPSEVGHLRAASNDQEILDLCELLRQATGSPATVITADSGMRTSAQTRGIDIFKLSDSDLLSRHKSQREVPAKPTDPGAVAGLSDDAGDGDRGAGRGRSAGGGTGSRS